MIRDLLAAARAVLPVRFGRRPPLWAPDFPFLLLWSHKSASTALAQWFFAQIGSPHLRDGGPDAARRYAGLGIHAYQFDVHCRSRGYQYHCRRALAGSRPTIKFVRDPAARAFSAFIATRRSVVLRRPDFWGARVSRQILAWKGEVDVRGAYSFAEFLEWMAATPPARQNPHVRGQHQSFEAGRSIEIMPIEDLHTELARLEQRFSLAPVSARLELLASAHHRPRSGPMATTELESLLCRPLVPGAFDGQAAPLVDSAALAGTSTGARLREVFARDYQAYPLY